jgi:hypothetical protein
MVTGKTYEEIRFAFPRVDFAKEGIAFYQAEAYLAEHGYAVRRKTHFDPLLGDHRDPWPCEPFAAMHMCEVIVPGGCHSIVLLGDGTVLDPWTAERTTLAHPDYLRLHFVAGIYQV